MNLLFGLQSPVHGLKTGDIIPKWLAPAASLSSVKAPRRLDQSALNPRAVGRAPAQTDAGAAEMDLITAAEAGRTARGQNAVPPASQTPSESR
ncbi:MAG: hypothetical protein QGH33_07855, partial [Pirellulaceae bacterium]|nr:hypothetical protein [Pirellulaceae bacterium]